MKEVKDEDVAYFLKVDEMSIKLKKIYLFYI
jgi:hypothetical protein